MEAASVPAAAPPARRRSRGTPERRLAAYMVAPSLALIALVALWPIVYAIWLSLHEYSLVQAGVSRWAEPFGLGNYQDALASKEFWRATRITVAFTRRGDQVELTLADNGAGMDSDSVGGTSLRLLATACSHLRREAARGRQRPCLARGGDPQ